jgi:hypothetical protein
VIHRQVVLVLVVMVEAVVGAVEVISKEKVEALLWKCYGTELHSNPMEYMKGISEIRESLIEILKEDDPNWKEPTTHERLTTFFPNLR